MAKSDAVWGIDIGQCALKALRCRLGDDDEAVVADAFDYIEYPKILSQPDADPDELIREALETFLERNEVKGDQIALAVPGQNGLSRFFKPPPVDAKKMADIVKYEARQQIPFALEDVIWDFQQIGGQVVDGFVMDAEVGLFAMKRDQVFRALKPFTDAEVEVDIVQLAPLSIYNEVCHELLGDVPEPDEIDPDNPPESLVILSMGTDTTDLVITNGIKLWQRSIPLGGNHFTKQLTKELKLTYAKAEHLKRNARQAEDPKTVFQVMRPVFNDLVTEVQRSIGYFQSIDRQAKIGRMVMLGNAVKLPGLRQYLAKNLGLEVAKHDSFARLTGSSVVSAKSFKDNVLSFGVCYGLCLQGVQKAKIGTNLLPQEFHTERLIREKKPWALAAVGVLLLFFALNYFFHYKAWWKINEERTVNGFSWKDSLQLVNEQAGISSDLDRRDREQEAEWDRVKALGEEVVGNGDRKLLMLELYKAIHDALPHDKKYAANMVLDPKKVPFAGRVEFNIDYVDSQYFPDLQVWFNVVKSRYLAEMELAEGKDGATAKANEEAKAAEAAKADAAAKAGPDPFADPSSVYSAAPTEAIDTGPEQKIGPEGPGWVIEIAGSHYHNNPLVDNRRLDVVGLNEGGAYVRSSFLKNLKEKKISLPVYTDSGPVMTEFTFEELGIGYAILAQDPRIDRRHRIANWNHPQHAANAPRAGASDGGALLLPMAPGTGTSAGTRPETIETDEPLDFAAPRYDFVIQLCWQEKTLQERIDERKKTIKFLEKKEDEKEAAKTAAEPADADTTGGE